MDDYGRCVIRTADETLSTQSAAKFRSLKKRIDGELREMISDAIADRTVAPLDVRLTAFALAGALNWSARWYRPEDGITATVLASRLVDILTAGLAPREATDAKLPRKRKSTGVSV